MSSLKIVVFPGPEGVAYTTERKAVQSNPMIGFLSDHSTTRTREQIYTIEQITTRQLEADKRKNFRNRRQLVCPPILDLAMNKRQFEKHPAQKHRRIINGFFPSKIRTTSTNLGCAKESKDKQDPFEELVPDPNAVSYQNGPFMGRAGSKHSQQYEPSIWRVHAQQVLSLRNGSPSPWINRYQLKKKSISACNTGDFKSQSVPFEQISRGLSR